MDRSAHLLLHGEAKDEQNVADATMTRWIFSNIALKIGSVAIALLLWFHVVTERWVVETVTAPIKYQGLAEDLVVVNEVQTEVRFQVRTKVKQLILLDYLGNPFARIDLSTVTQGSNVIDLSGEFIVLPSWRPLEVMGIVGPKSIAIETDSRAEKTVAVKPQFSGTPLEGNFIKTIRLVPDTVVLIGGQTQIRKVKEVYTDTIDVAGRHEKCSIETGIMLPEPGFTSTTEMVTVQLTFERYRLKTLSGVPITLKGNRHLVVLPGSLEVTVMGPESLLEEVASKDIKVFVDAKAPGTAVVPFFNLPDGIAFKSCDPPRVEVREGKESKE
jgi:YbbR domain-containing protein